MNILKSITYMYDLARADSYWGKLFEHEYPETQESVITRSLKSCYMYGGKDSKQDLIDNIQENKKRHSLITRDGLAGVEISGHGLFFSSLEWLAVITPSILQSIFISIVALAPLYAISHRDDVNVHYERTANLVIDIDSYMHEQVNKDVDQPDSQDKDAILELAPPRPPSNIR